MKRRMLIALPLLLAAASAAVHGQDYRTRPVRMMVPFSPGGSNDIVTRLIKAGALRVD
jgi:tripartite-type tricarboxylate transporter receptor subunit TctC